MCLQPAVLNLNVQKGVTGAGGLSLVTAETKRGMKQIMEELLAKPDCQPVRVNEI